MSICFQAIEALARLRELDKQPPPSSVSRVLGSQDRRTRLKVGDITMKECLFQPRDGMNEEHVEALMRIRNDGRELDAVLVIQIGPQTILLDGHHRLEAYRRHPARDSGIPVEFFAGGLEEALDAAAEANAKLRLQMSDEERKNLAWRRTVLAVGSIRQVAQVAGVSERTVTTMRQVRDRIASGEGPTPSTKPGYFGTWREARKAVRKDTEDAPLDYDDYRDQKARNLADDLYKKHGVALTRDPEIMARVLEHLYEDRVGEVLTALRERVEECHDDGENEDTGDTERTPAMTF